MNNPVFIVGYSGHAYVVVDIFNLNQIKVAGYCDVDEKEFNPFSLSYLGKETNILSHLSPVETKAFTAIGLNSLRIKVDATITALGFEFANAIHPKAIVASTVQLQTGILIAANASINPMCKIGKQVICNTGCVIEHECVIGNYTHIAPGAVLCGNVTIGTNCFVGANAVIKQGVKIGNNVIIGAGSTVISDIEENKTVVGNPHKIIK